MPTDKLYCRVVLAIVLAVAARNVLGHGLMQEPPNRSSLWRFFDDAPINYDDNQNFCGGRAVQWEAFGGKCGVCGDKYTDPHPQANENTGLYGKRGVVRTYQSGSVINISIDLSVNHLGTFEYALCVLESPNAIESGEECFRSLVLGDGSTKYPVTADDRIVNHTLVLPYGLTCERCVLRWHYNTGNSWGVCSNGTQGMGCGQQETFRSCSDIAIV